jgi:CRP-like cAMP-binding protein
LDPTNQTNFIHKSNNAKRNASKGMRGGISQNHGEGSVPSDDNVLEKSALLRNMTAQCRHTLLVNVKERTVEDGGFLCKQGEVGTTMLIIKTGEVRLFRSKNDPVQQVAAQVSTINRCRTTGPELQSCRGQRGGVPKQKGRSNTVEVPAQIRKGAVNMNTDGSSVSADKQNQNLFAKSFKTSGPQVYMRKLGVGDTVGESHLMAMFAPGGERDDDDDDDQATTARRRRASMIRRGVGETTDEHQQDQQEDMSLARSNREGLIGRRHSAGVLAPPRAGIGDEQVLRWPTSAVAVGKVRVLELEHSVFRQLVDWWPDFLREMRNRRQYMYDFGFHLPLFDDLNASARNMAMGALKLVEVGAGEIIVRQTMDSGSSYRCTFKTPIDDGSFANEREPGMYFIHDGELSVLRKGREVCKLQKGDFFGEQALLANSRHFRTATIVSTRMCRMYQLEKRAFESICEWHPEFAKQITSKRDYVFETSDRAKLFVGIDDALKNMLVSQRLHVMPGFT